MIPALIVGGLAGAGLLYYASKHVTLAAVQAEIAKLEASASAEGAKLLADLKAALKL